MSFVLVATDDKGNELGFVKGSRIVTLEDADRFSNYRDALNNSLKHLQVVTNPQYHLRVREVE